MGIGIPHLALDPFPLISASTEFIKERREDISEVFRVDYGWMG